MGDKPGHEFHGNQYGSGHAGRVALVQDLRKKASRQIRPSGYSAPEYQGRIASIS